MRTTLTTPLLTTLFLTALLLTRCFPASAQCDFPVTLTTTPNNCLGSTLRVNSTHAIKEIVWCQDGRPVANTLAAFSPGSLIQASNGVRIPGGDTLGLPMGLFVDDSGNIYLTAFHLNSIIKWSPGANTWTTAAGGNGIGTALNQVNQPTGCLLDKAGNLYIVENYAVMKWAPGATAGTIVAGNNGTGADPDQLTGPITIALDCDDNLYITDAGNYRVQRWAPGATSGVTVAGGNGRGNAPNQLAFPSGVAVDGEKNVFVIDPQRIVKWAPGATAGITVATFGQGSGNNQLANPFNIFVDNNDTLYLNDIGSDDTERVVKLAPGATQVVTIIDKRRSGGYFNAICAFVDSKGTIYGGMTTQDLKLLAVTRPTSIDNSFKPVSGGRYYAVVTDILGYSSTTDTLVISPPPAGPPSIQITAQTASLDLCQPDSFSATSTNAGLAPTYQWQVSGVNVGGDSTAWSSNLFANGDQVYCIITTIGTSCEPIQDTSNIVTLSVDPQGHATVTIATSDSAVCTGTPITLTATVINGAANPGIDWYVNGQPTGIGTPTFTDSTIGSAVVFCEITSDASCGLAKSNSIPIGIYPVPSVPNQQFSVRHGQRLTLDPIIYGDPTSYLWTPGSGLSDSSIRNPVADPLVTTVYTLAVASPGGCQAKGSITVDVYTPLSMPNAFTPNGDGRNDILYVLGGPTGSIVHSFAIFDRWGANIFTTNDVAPGDRTHGWDGTIAHHPAPPGTYIYLIVLTLPGGRQQVYKGTVELIR